MRVLIYAHFCEFEKRDGYTSCTHRPLDPMPYRQEVEARNADELNAALDTAFKYVRSAHPGRSFFVAEFRPRGAKDRAFAGYAKRRWKREFDAAEESTRLEQAQAQFGERLQIVSVK